MNDERRTHDRSPTFTNVDLTARDPSGKERVVAIMVRDESLPGLGGVYVGHDPPTMEEVFIQGQGAESRELQLAWIKSLAEYVSIVGFQYL